MNQSNANLEEENRLLILLVATAKPLELALGPDVVPQIGDRKDLEAQRALTMTIAALMRDVVHATWLCAKEGAIRQLQVLERQAFELSTRSCFYVENADVADEHFRSTNKQFVRVARKMYGQDSKDFKDFESRVLTNDGGFSSGTNAQTSSKPSFEAMCIAVYGNDGQKLYAGHYSIPSAVTHGAPAAFAHVFEEVGKGYRLRAQPGLLNRDFILKSIAQCGINAAASIGYLFQASGVAKGVVLCEELYRSFGYAAHLLVKREFRV